jgi:hypothetical protein
MRWLSAFIVLYLLGYLVFTGLSIVFDLYHETDTSYFIWASISHGGLLAWIAIYFLVPIPVRKLIFKVCVFAVSLAVWEIISVVAGIPINDQWAELVVFLIVLGVISSFMFSDFRKLNNYL